MYPSIPAPSMLLRPRKLFGRQSLNYSRNQNVWLKLGQICIPRNPPTNAKSSDLSTAADNWSVSGSAS